MPDKPFKGIRITSDPDETAIEQPATGSAQPTNRTPLRLLLVSNLTPHETVPDWSDGERVVRLDKNNFAAIMQQMTPRLALEVPNTISEAPKLLDVELGFADLDAFHPAQVAQQIPPLAQLLQIRTLVDAVRTKEIDLETFQQRLTETGVDAGWAAQLYQTLSKPPRPSAPASSGEATSGSAGGGTLDRLLGMVSLDEEAPQEPETSAAGGGASGGLLGSLIHAVAGEPAATPQVEKTAADVLVADLDVILGDQLNAVFGHPAFRQLEAAWRGLKFLVDRIDFRKNIQLEVLAAGKDDLSAALYYQVLLPEHSNEMAAPPLSLIVLDAAFDNSSADLALLEDLAGTGASLQVPVLASAAAAFFGVDDYSALATLPPLWQHVEAPEYIAWNKLRDKPAARYLALALPAFLLRAPYDAAKPAKTFAFEEAGGLWGNATVAVAAAVARSVAETDWPTHFVGNSRSIGSLPIWKSRQGHTPLAVLIPDAKLGEFTKGGFVVLGGMINHDALHVARAVTVCRPETYEDLMVAAEARIHVTLACTLFVARAAHHLLVIQNDIAPGTPLEQVRQDVEARLRAFFHTEGHLVPPDAVQVEAADDAGVPDHDLLAIRLNTPRYMLDRPVSLVLGLPVPKGA